MKALNPDEIRQYVNENIDDFHNRRVNAIQTLTL